MNKHFTLLLLVALLCNSGVWAARISEQQALQHAVNFLQGKNIRQSAVPRLLKSKAQMSQKCNYFVFNSEEQDSGFVIVAADDRVPVILGYALRGTFNVSTVPCNLRWLLDYYDSCIGGLPDESAEASVSSNSAQRADISPLITTQWGQGSPYNALCPKFQGETCKTGCVATSMAQIINFHRWPQAQTSCVDAYVSSSYQISMPELPPTQFNWEDMTETEVARLMLYCGQSVRMDYGPQESRTNPDQAVMALTKVFGYSRSTSFIYREDYDEDEWEDIIYQELSEGRPLVYNGSSSEGAASFIVSGYKDQLFHMNWGWSGDYDGYYALTGLTPTNNVDNGAYQTAFVGIQPSAGTMDSDRPKVVVKDIYASTKTLIRSDVSEDFTPRFSIISSVVSDLDADATMQLGLGVYNNNGLILVLDSISHTFCSDEACVHDYDVHLSSLPIGDYTIKAIYRLQDDDTWHSDAASNNYYIKLTVKKGRAELRARPKAEIARGTEEFGIHTIDGITYCLESRFSNLYAYLVRYNETEKYAGDIYVPNQVSYDNKIFNVIGMYEHETPFIDCPELTSLSVGVSVSVSNCPKLKNLDIRQGVIVFGQISQCDALETLSYPKSMSSGVLPGLCKSLKSFTINNDKLFRVNTSYNSWKDNILLWDHERMPALTDVYFNSDFPMEFIYESEDMVVNPNVTIHIPQGTLPVYQQTQWKDWNIQEDLPPLSPCVKWDYCGNNPLYVKDAAGSGGWGIYISRGNNNVEFAMCVPARLIEPYKGCKVTKIEFHTRHNLYSNMMEDVEYVFLTKPGTDYLAKEPVTTIRGTWNIVELPKPYVITGDTLFVGIGRNEILEAFWADKDVVDEGFYLRVMGHDDSFGMADEVGVWQKHAGVSDWNFALPIRFYIEGEKLPVDLCINQVSLANQQPEQESSKPFKAHPVPSREQVQHSSRQYFTNDKYFTLSTGKPATPIETTPQHILRRASDGHFQLQADVRSRTVDPIRSLTFSWNIDNHIQGSQSFDTCLLPNHEGTYLIDLPTGIGGRNHKVVLEVSEINGKSDEIKANSSDTTAFALPPTTRFPRRVVMEEITATWCGWCPRYIAAIKRFSTQYPDNFIAISIHENDMMHPIGNSFDPFYAMFNSIPGSLINRTGKFDPNLDYILDMFEDAKDNGDATIEASAYFVSIDSSRVAVTTQTTFGYSENNVTEYRIAYVVLEDQVGPYLQANNYSDPQGYNSEGDYLGEWRILDNQVSMTFNDVARSILPNWEGASGCVPSIIKEGETYSHTYKLTLPENIQQKSNLRIVTLLIDGSTGEIMNAAQTPVIYDAEVAIDEQPASRQPFNIYNIAGAVVRRQATSLQGLRKGVYVIDGKKIVVQ